MRKYTLVLHDYIGYGSYVIEYRRIRCKPEALEKYFSNVRRGTPHFYIPGWPVVTWLNGMPYFKDNTTKLNTQEPVNV